MNQIPMSWHTTLCQNIFFAPSRWCRRQRNAEERILGYNLAGWTKVLLYNRWDQTPEME